MDPVKDAIFNNAKKEFTITRSDVTTDLRVGENLKDLFDHKVTIIYELKTTLEKKGVPVLTFEWGFDLTATSIEKPKGMMATITLHKIK